MNQIDQIKELQRQGHGSLEIAGRLKIDRKTVAKYMREKDFNEKAREKRAPASKLDPWKPIIDGWLEEDQRMRFKQRHTAPTRPQSAPDRILGGLPLLLSAGPEVFEAKEE